MNLKNLEDITFTYLTEGDLLLYGEDGTWHNIHVYDVGINGSSSVGSGVSIEDVKRILKGEGATLFLSKTVEDLAEETITFKKGLISDGNVKVNNKIQFGNFALYEISGNGGQIDNNGNATLKSLILRDFLEVPELRYNKVDVVSGELWNSICFGLIESVDTEYMTVTLKLEDGEYSGIKLNDICKGMFHNMVGNVELDETDENGFQSIAGFTTVYFKVKEVLDTTGKTFTYELQPGTSNHPCKSMKFVVYGNTTDVNRQFSAYHTKTYTRYLKNVDDWVITWLNIASLFGDLNGLNIPGAPNNGNLQGNGAYLDNVYMTGATIQFTPELEEEMKGKDGQSSYIHIKYSDVPNPQLPELMNDTEGEYMGVCTNTEKEAPQDPTKYTWNLIIGADGADGAPGAPGAPGADGKDGKDGVNGKDGKNGADGADGKIGLSILREDWSVDRPYRNDSDTDGINGVRYLYWVHLKDDPANVWYVAKAAHNGINSAESNKPGTDGGTNYWTLASSSYAIYTPALFANKLGALEIDVDSLTVKHLKTESTIDSKSLNIQSNLVQMTNESGELSLQIDGNIVNSLSDLIGGSTNTVSFPFTSQTKQTNASSSTPSLEGSIVMLDYADCGITDDKTYQVGIPQIKLSTSLTTTIGPEPETSYAFAMSYVDICVEIENGGTYIILSKQYYTSSGVFRIKKTDISNTKAIYTNKRYRIVANYSITTYADNTGTANASITIAKNDSDSTISVAEISKLTRIYGNGIIIKQATNKYINIGTFADNSQLINAKDTDGTNSVYNLNMVETKRIGDSWYRKWNNGWLECGGLLSTTTNSRQTQNYPIAFISTPFVVTAPYGTEYNETYEHGAIYTNTLTYFTWERSDNYDLYWYACGLWKTLDN